jgi:hypothetical protein
MGAPPEGLAFGAALPYVAGPEKGGQDGAVAIRSVLLVRSGLLPPSSGLLPPVYLHHYLVSPFQSISPTPIVCADRDMSEMEIGLA